MIDIYDMGENGKLHSVTLGSYIFYISYSTIVAFSTPEDGLVICENVWSMTTGRHLNRINSDKKIRLSSSVYEAKLNEVTLLLEQKLKYSAVYQLEDISTPIINKGVE